MLFEDEDCFGEQEESVEGQLFSESYHVSLLSAVNVENEAYVLLC